MIFCSAKLYSSILRQIRVDLKKLMDEFDFRAARGSEPNPLA